ncbi:uncharacterized protein LOC107054405 isoform X2 [Gallus gallus]|uniref:uncharacterized protein LOC107054405 isoform X2 n=1 Tax=Gallus gallus TaxID=9031 RepID=UPI001F027CC4|nr:uncharacterized protein LOC107054405 isoform X2 [Gallus gallus]
MSRPVPALPSPGLLAEGNREVGSCLSAISALQYWLRMRQKRSSTRQQCTPNQIALQEPRAAWMKPEVKIRCNITLFCAGKQDKYLERPEQRAPARPSPCTPLSIWGSSTQMAQPSANLHVLPSNRSKVLWLMKEETWKFTHFQLYMLSCTHILLYILNARENLNLIGFSL